MTDNATLNYMVLNIAANPHPDGVYLNLFNKVSGKKVKYYGDSYATITRPQSDQEGYFRGSILTWLQIDKNEPAIDIERMQEIEAGSLDFDLAEKLGFNLKIFSYYFRIRDHLLFVEIKNEFNKSISHRNVRSIISKLFSKEYLDHDDPNVEVTVIPEKDALPRILGIYRINKIIIHIVKPNPDDSDVSEVLAEMERRGAKSQELTLVSDKKADGLKLDAEIIAKAKVAEHNGYVKASGRDIDGHKISLNTKEYPENMLIEIGGDHGVVQKTYQMVKNYVFGRAP